LLVGAPSFFDRDSGEGAIFIFSVTSLSAEFRFALGLYGNHENSSFGASVAASSARVIGGAPGLEFGEGGAIVYDIIVVSQTTGSTGTTGTTATTGIPPGWGYWPMNETFGEIIYDYGGLGIHGESFNVTHNGGDGLSFDGLESWIVFNSSEALSTTFMSPEWSIQFSFRLREGSLPSGPYSLGTPLSYGFQNDQELQGWSFSLSYPPVSSVDFYGGDFPFSCLIPSIQWDTWYAYTLVKRNYQLECWVDGTLISTRSYYSSPSPTFEDLKAGVNDMEEEDFSWYFAGDLKEVRIVPSSLFSPSTTGTTQSVVITTAITEPGSTSAPLGSTSDTIRSSSTGNKGLSTTILIAIIVPLVVLCGILIALLAAVYKIVTRRPVEYPREDMIDLPTMPVQPTVMIQEVSYSASDHEVKGEDETSYSDFTPESSETESSSLSESSGLED